MSLLSIADDVLAEVGLIMPARLVGNADPTARRVVSAAKSAAEHIYRAHDWSILAREHLFETEADERGYQVPDDWGRATSMTAWDRVTYWQMRGSLTPQQWQFQRSALVASATIQRQFRLQQGPLAAAILIDPVPATTGQELVIEYVSSYWCEDSAGEGQAGWLADTDEFRLDHEVFKLEVLWRVKRANGHPYGDDRQDAEIALRRAKIADVAMESFDTVGRHFTNPQVPEGSWPVS